MTYALFVDHRDKYDDIYRAAASESGLQAEIARNPADALITMCLKGVPRILFSESNFQGRETGTQLLDHVKQSFPGVRRVELGYEENEPSIYAHSYIKKPF